MGGFEIFQQGFCRQEVNWAGLGKTKQGLVSRNLNLSLKMSRTSLLKGATIRGPYQCHPWNARPISWSDPAPNQILLCNI